MSGALKYNNVIVSSKGQVVIPNAFRKALGIHNKTNLICHITEDGAISMKPAKYPIEKLFGLCKGKGEEPYVPKDDIDNAIMQAVRRNDERTKC
jgi:bifunctional DNA-binding transcriptional regulator/antitoxin component of YhaV-PrlF toxin-antitoxin module